MIDYISATKYHCKDKPNFCHCKPFSSQLNDYGWETYYLDGCERMQVLYSHSHGIRIKGSLPYFLKGHNFKFSNEEFIQSIDYIDTLLGCVGLWDAVVDTFEDGVIMPVECKPKEYISNHYAAKATKLKLQINSEWNGKCAIWKRSDEDIKLYDAGANILMKQGFTRRKVIEDAGWNPSTPYLKYEIRYKKPFLMAKDRQVIRLDTLQNDCFRTQRKSKLMDEYQLLTPMKTIVMPTEKKNLSSLDAVVITLTERAGLPVEDVKKMVFQTINQAGCLSKTDKDARKAQIRKAFGKLEESSSSQWDLSPKIQIALECE